MTPPEDRAGGVFRWIHRVRGGRAGAAPAAFDPDAVASTLRATAPIFGARRSWFRPTVKGLEHVPEPPVLLVSNHSGGLLLLDVWGLVVSWYRWFGVDRPVHVLGHELLFVLDLLSRPLQRVGVVRAERDVAWRVLQEWKRDLLVMPGGDLEVFRPWADRYRVRFGGRTGYASLAIRAQVPIVPVANVGAHSTLIVLTSGRRLAEKLGLPRYFRAGIFPIHLSLPWGLAVGPWPHLPLPHRLRYRVGRPIQPPPWEGDGLPPQALVDALDQQVRAAIQALLDDLGRQRPLPLRIRAALRWGSR